MGLTESNILGFWSFFVPKKNNSIHCIKSSKERYLLGQNTTSEFSGYSPLLSYKTTLKQQLNGENDEKWDGKLITYYSWLSVASRPQKP